MKINMRTTLCTLTLLLGLAACSEDEGGTSIVLTNGTQTSQTIYADETTDNAGGIHFTAAADWTATVTAVSTKAEGGSSVDWLSLSKYSGGPGEYTLTLTLKENTTGQDRKAQIEIRCGSDVITITVEQKGTTEGGDTPAEPVEPEADKYYVARIDEVHPSPDGETSRNIYYFEYDDQGRITQVTTDDNGEGLEEDMFRTTYEYSGNTIILREYYPDEEGPVDVPGTGEAVENATRKPFIKTRAAASEDEDVTIFTLDENNRVTTIDYEWYDGSDVVKGTATVQYDENGYLTGGTDKYTLSYNPGVDYEYVDKAEWQNGNLVKVTHDYYGENADDYVAEMRYENPAYVNNPKVNFDLTWMICESEWMGCFISDMAAAVNAFGYMGKRGELMMTHEYDRISYGYNTEYTYEYDALDRPVKVYKKCTPKSGSSDYVSEYTYTITYAD